MIPASGDIKPEGWSPPLCWGVGIRDGVGWDGPVCNPFRRPVEIIHFTRGPSIRRYITIPEYAAWMNDQHKCKLELTNDDS